ncbi:hypothetical protein VPHK356_0128 [Vibrio phage K356]|nr:hypothetical protein MYOV002v2_p0121 [Vibrio phage 144E46.1]
MRSQAPKTKMSGADKAKHDKNMKLLSTAEEVLAKLTTVNHSRMAGPDSVHIMLGGICIAKCIWSAKRDVSYECTIRLPGFKENVTEHSDIQGALNRTSRRVAFWLDLTRLKL